MKLLLVEDEKDLAKSLTTILKMNNYIVDNAYDGQEALCYIERVKYDAIILDIMLPKFNGIEVLKKVRSNENTTPIIMLTAKNQIEDKCLGLDLGADDYITKPFFSKELLSRLKAVMRRDTKFVEEVLEFGNLKLDKSTATLLTEFGTVDLVNKEYQIMELFMQKPSRIHSIDFILEQLWGFDSYAEINTVWVYISNIRKKLVEIQSNVEIKVKRNIGYYLELI